MVIAYHETYYVFTTTTKFTFFNKYNGELIVIRSEPHTEEHRDELSREAPIVKQRFLDAVPLQPRSLDWSVADLDSVIEFMETATG